MKKSIVIVHETLEGGGAEKVLVNILDSIDYDKYNIDLLLIYKKGIYLKDINKNVNIKYIISEDKNTLIHKIRNKILKNFIIRYFGNFIWKKFIGNNYDIEIAFLEGPSSEIISKSTNMMSKKVAWIHTDLRRLRRLSKKREEKLYCNINNVVGVSNEVANAFKELYPMYGEKIKVIYNLIDTKKIIELSSEKINEVYEGKNIIAIGRLINSKRFDLIIKAHKEVIKKGVKHNLIILGEGPLEKELKNLCKDLKLENSVKFIGFKKNPYPYIKLSDLYIMASDYEGLPLVICEALTLGKAIISTNCTGPSELLNEGESGILVKRGDYLELAEKIEMCLRNEKIRKGYEFKSLEQVELFKSDNIIKQIYDLF